MNTTIDIKHLAAAVVAAWSLAIAPAGAQHVIFQPGKAAAVGVSLAVPGKAAVVGVPLEEFVPELTLQQRALMEALLKGQATNASAAATSTSVLPPATDPHLPVSTMPSSTARVNMHSEVKVDGVEARQESQVGLGPLELLGVGVPDVFNQSVVKGGKAVAERGASILLGGTQIKKVPVRGSINTRSYNKFNRTDASDSSQVNGGGTSVR